MISYIVHMNRNPALVFILSISLLFSMTEIYKVTMLGFTVLTDADKAAQFCTCTGCSHSHNGMSKNEDQNMAGHGMDQHQQCDKEGPSHCSTNGKHSGSASVCACKTDTDRETPILYNSLDKVALLIPVKNNRPSEKERVLHTYQKRNETSLSKDIFHPPKQV